MLESALGGVGRTGAVSSFTMVPVAVVREIVAPDGLDNFTVNFSFDSTVVSPITPTVTDFAVSPAANVSVPELAT